VKLYAVMYQSGLWMGIDRRAVERKDAVCMAFELASTEASLFTGAEVVLFGFAI
jgi:hypothetical protein